MVQVRPQDLSFMAGGSVASRNGVFMRRTSPAEDVAEIFARSTTGPRFDENGVVRDCAIDVPRLNWRDYDRDGVYEQAVLPINPQTINLIEFNVPGGTPADMETFAMTVANLTAEYYTIFDVGDDYTETAGANFDPNNWEISGWVKPNWANTDGDDHFILDIYKDANNYIRVYKVTTGVLRVRCRIVGAFSTVDLTQVFSAGTELFIGARMNSGVLTAYVDTDGDNTLETGTAAAGQFAAGGSWTINVGMINGSALSFDGGLNLLITNDGRTDDAIQDRFNSGNGLALAGDDGWLARYGKQLVFHIGANSDGSLTQADSFQGATDLLAGDAYGRYEFDGTNYLTITNPTFLDGAAAASFMFAFDIDSIGGNETVASRWGAANNQKQFLISARAGGLLRFAFATDLVGGVGLGDTPAVLSATSRYWVWVRFNGAGGADADRLKISIATRDPLTGRYGAFISQTLAFIGAIPAAMTTPGAATSMRVASRDDAAQPLTGHVDDLRINEDTALATTTLDRQLPDYALPGLWDHHWPMDNDADDQIGTEDFTPTNSPVQVADGRHGIGQMERWTKAGQYAFDGTNDVIDFGDLPELDGLVKFAAWGAFEVGDAVSGQALAGRWDTGDNTKKQILIQQYSKFQIAVATDAAGTAAAADSATTFTVGDKYAWVILFDGEGASNAERMKLALAKFNPLTGLYDAFVDETISFTGTMPGYFQALAAATDFRCGVTNNDAADFLGTIDDQRLWFGDNCPTWTQLKALSPYDEIIGQPAGTPDPDHWWDMNLNADDIMGHFMYTFARADTNFYESIAGLITETAAGELRDKHAEWSPTPNLNSEDNLAAWTPAGSPVITPNVADPDGGTEAFTVADDDGGVQESLFDVLTSFTGDGLKTVVFVVKENTMPGSGNQILQVWDVGGAAARMQADITSWSSGNPQITETTGTLLSKTQIGSSGWWIIRFQTTSVTAANAHRAWIYPAATAAQTGSIDVWRVNVFDSSYPPGDAILDESSAHRHPMTLLEAGYTNLLDQSDLTAWTKVQTPIVTGSVSDPAGGTAAFTVEDDGPVNEEYIYTEPTYTGTSKKSVKISVKENTMPGSGVQRISLYDWGGVNQVLFVDISAWVGGRPTAAISGGFGVLLDQYQIGDTGWWMLVCQSDSFAPTGNERLLIEPAVQADQTGKIDVYLPETYDEPFPPRGLHGDSEVTTKDEFKEAISGWTPGQGYTLYLKMKNYMLANTGSEFTAVSLGDEDSVGSALRLFVDNTSDNWVLRSRTTASGIVASVLGAPNDPSIGDDFEFRFSVPSSGDITWGVSKNGGTEVTQTQTPGAWDGAFNALFLHMMMNGASGNQGNGAIYEIKGFDGAAKSLDDCRDDTPVNGTDPFHYAPGMSIADVDGAVTGAIQWPDGRQPEGWTVSGSPEIDRTLHLGGATFSRDSVATEGENRLTTPPATQRQVGAGLLRDRHFVTANDGNEYRTALMEDTRANGWTYSEELNQGVWTKTQTTISANAAVASDGELTADKVVEDVDVGGTHYVTRLTPALTNDTVSTLSVFVKAAERTEVRLNITTKFGGTIQAWYDLSTGVVGTTSGASLARMKNCGGGWYRCQLSGDVLAGGASPQGFVILGSGSETASYNGDGSSGLYVWGMQFEVDKPFASSYMPTGAATATRAVEALDFFYPHAPQEMTMLITFIEGGTIVSGGSEGVWQIGNAAGDTPTIVIYESSGKYVVLWHNGAISAQVGMAVAPEIGDLVELRVTLSSAGVVQLHQSINGAAETSSSAGSAVALPAAFAAELTSPTNANLIGFGAYISAKIESGTNDRTTMRALTQADLFHWAPGAYSDDGMYGVRMEQPGAAEADIIISPSVTDEKWVGYYGLGRETVAGTARFFINGTQFGGSKNAALDPLAEMISTAVAARAASTGANGFRVLLDAGDAVYFDNLEIHQFATLTPSITKGDAFPKIDGLGGPWGIADATIVTASGEGIPLPFDTDFGTKVMKLDSGPAGSGTRRYLFGLPGTMNGFTANTLAGMVVGIYVPTSSEITPAQVTTHAVDDQGSSAGDAATMNDQWEWLWCTRVWDASATEAYFEVRLADGVSLSGADQEIYMAVPTAIDQGVPIVPIPQATEGTSTVEEEDFYGSFEIPPTASGFYVKLRAWVPGGLLYIGAAGDTGARIILDYDAANTLIFTYTDGTTTREVETVGTVDPGEEIEILGNISSTGQIQLTVIIDGATEEQTALAAALTLPDDWGGKRAYIGSKGGGEHATCEVLYAKIVRESTYTLQEVAAVQ